jgi:putative oxidoreductase
LFVWDNLKHLKTDFMIVRLLFPANTHNRVTSFALLFLRIAFAAMMMTHGWKKLADLDSAAQQFALMGVGGMFLVKLAVFAEFLCAAGVLAGLFFRLSLIPLIVTMCVAFFFVHGGKFVGEGNGELALLYLVVFLVLTVTGPGKYAIDNLIRKNISNYYSIEY